MLRLTSNGQMRTSISLGSFSLYWTANIEVVWPYVCRENRASMSRANGLPAQQPAAAGGGDSVSDAPPHRRRVAVLICGVPPQAVLDTQGATQTMPPRSIVKAKSATKTNTYGS